MEAFKFVYIFVNITNCTMKKKQQDPRFPNGEKSFKATSEVLNELLPEFYPAIDKQDLADYIIMFERLNFNLKWKLGSEEWEEKIVSFAENRAKQLKYEKESGYQGIIIRRQG